MLINYVSRYIINVFISIYGDEDVDSFDVSSSLISKHININNDDFIQEYMDAIDIMHKNIIYTSEDFISINVVPFDGITISSHEIILVVESYIY